MAEQAISAIYALAKHPDVLCSEIIRRKTKAVFSKPKTDSATDQPMEDEAAPEDPASDVEMEDADAQEHTEGEEPTEAPQPAPKQTKSTSQISRTVELSQLLFIVGHVAIKQIVHLELIEMEFKRRKAAADKAKQAANEGGAASKEAAEQDELDLIGGTTEDDFAEAMGNIREKELLYGEKSLLRHFGPLVTEICSSNMVYRNRDLQAAATLCMAKLMCVSGENKFPNPDFSILTFLQLNSATAIFLCSLPLWSGLRTLSLAAMWSLLLVIWLFALTISLTRIPTSSTDA